MLKGTECFAWWDMEGKQFKEQKMLLFWQPAFLFMCLVQHSYDQSDLGTAEVSLRNRHSTFPMFHGRLCWWIEHYAANPNPHPFFLSFFFSFSLSHSLHTTVHTPSLPLCSRPLGLWSSGVRWVGVLVGGSWGCRAARAGIQGNMHREITIAPLGDLQMLAEQGIVVGSYRYTSISWETAKQHIQPASLLSLSFFLQFSVRPSTSPLPSFPSCGNSSLFCILITLKKIPFQTEKGYFVSQYTW